MHGACDTLARDPSALTPLWEPVANTRQSARVPLGAGPVVEALRADPGVELAGPRHLEVVPQVRLDCSCGRLRFAAVVVRNMVYSAFVAL